MDYNNNIYNFNTLSDENYLQYFVDDTSDYNAYHMEHLIGRFNSIKK